MSRGRIASLVLCTPERVLGVLPPLTVAWPSWQGVDDVLRACREAHRLDVVILRILTATGTNGDGGPVAYLAQVDEADPALAAVTLAPWAGPDPLAPHPLRARPGVGPVAGLHPMEPVAELLDAVTYQRFLDHVEPDEHPYHAGDPLTCPLRAAAALTVAPSRPSA